MLSAEQTQIQDRMQKIDSSLDANRNRERLEEETRKLLGIHSNNGEQQGRARVWTDGPLGGNGGDRHGEKRGRGFHQDWWMARPETSMTVVGILQVISYHPCVILVYGFRGGVAPLSGWLKDACITNRTLYCLEH